jgi:polysaccharide export outer membrane protein
MNIEYFDAPSSTNQTTSSARQKIALSLLMLFAIVGSSGCSTLSSLGLPFSGSNNRILNSAKEISEAPGQALMMPNESAKQPLESYLIEVGDTIFVEPVSFDATIRLPGDQVIKPDGSISIGEFGVYQASQKTVEQIEMEIQSIIDSEIRLGLESEYREERLRESGLTPDTARPEFEEDDAESEEELAEAEQERRAALEERISERIKQNEISVRLVNWESKKIYVLGEVNSPGYFGYTGNQTVLDALLEAGGLTTKANHHQIIVSRPTPCGSCRVVMKVCYDQVVQLGDTSTNYQLHPGDRVFVPGLTFMDDVKKTLTFNQDPSCPRCAPCQQGCDLATGCQ